MTSRCGSTRAFNPNACEAETGRSLSIKGQPGLQSYSRTKRYREYKIKVKVNEIEVKIKRIKMENTQRILILYAIVLSLNCLNAEEGATAAKRYLFTNAAELIQHRYSENSLTLKFGSKDMILWKGVSFFVFTEDETLFISSIPIWYDGPCPPEGLL